MKLKALVKDIMKTDVQTVEYDTTIKKAATIMKENKIGSVVVTGAKKIKGILTAEDIVYKHIAEGKGHIVNDIMSSELITISPNLSLEDASRLMTSKHIKKLPVMENGLLVGIITATDIVKIEPTLFEILLERMKLESSPEEKTNGMEFVQCEKCGNFSDDIAEIDGEWVCGECETNEPSE